MFLCPEQSSLGHRALQGCINQSQLGRTVQMAAQLGACSSISSSCGVIVRDPPDTGGTHITWDTSHTHQLLLATNHPYEMGKGHVFLGRNLRLHTLEGIAIALQEIVQTGSNPTVECLGRLFSLSEWTTGTPLVFHGLYPLTLSE